MAGVVIFPAADRPLSFPVSSSLSIQQLYDTTYNKGTTDSAGNPLANPIYQDGVNSNVFMMIVNALTDDQNAAGIMFDLKRRGAAVFAGTINSFFGTGNSEMMANYVFTMVHELGHCLDLPHAFETHANWNVNSQLATFMNYAQSYTGPGTQDGSGFTAGRTTPGMNRTRYLNFWSTFRFQFAPQELLQLRHGARDAVLPGGIPYWGDFNQNRTPIILGDPAGETCC